MKTAERRTLASLPQTVSAEGEHSSHDQLDRPLARIRRIGRQLFEVADCVITFSNGDVQYPVKTAKLSSATVFCCSLPQTNDPVVVLDTLLEPALKKHPLITRSKGIRFYASHPVCDENKRVIGNICLVDHSPRYFSHTARALLADLAALVDRELYLQSVSVAKLNLQKKNKSLRRTSLIDPLLGTWNRGAIMRILSIEAVRCDKLGLPLSLIVIDLDYFKKINDTYGHPTGDAVLVEVAKRLRSCVQPQEAIGRYGGEEFLAVLPAASSETALATAERMRHAVAGRPEKVGNATLNLTISAGVASTVHFPSASTDELISRADMALYAAKDAGRNRIEHATPDLG